MPYFLVTYVERTYHRSVVEADSEEQLDNWLGFDSNLKLLEEIECEGDTEIDQISTEEKIEEYAGFNVIDSRKVGIQLEPSR